MIFRPEHEDISSAYLLYHIFESVSDLYEKEISKRIWPRILDILILQDKKLFGAIEAGDIVCWLVNQPIAKLDLFKSFACRWICKTYVEYCFRNSATVRRLVRSPTLQSTNFCGVHSDLRGKGIRVSPPWYDSYLPTYLSVYVCISSCSIDKKLLHCCFSVDKVKNKKTHRALQFLDVLLETYLLFLFFLA